MSPPFLEPETVPPQAIASRAQRLAAEHEHDADLTAEDVSFINGLDRRWDDAAGVDLGAGNTTLVSPPHFPAGVRLDGRASAVRFPTGVFEGWMWHKFKPLWWQGPPLFLGPAPCPLPIAHSPAVDLR